MDILLKNISPIKNKKIELKKNKKKVMVSIDEKIWSLYKKECKEKYLVPSFEIEKFMKENIEWI
ncbi:hypothetical protein A3K72_01935 [Candidatus Woesearchaeota archaeon RBG_13_36_6]|nr:MAG: hypothetical protein A3K72_01935 [Candidatus Woesearchaeota archaeon RBG_13_36_6]